MTNENVILSALQYALQCTVLVGKKIKILSEFSYEELDKLFLYKPTSGKVCPPVVNRELQQHTVKQPYLFANNNASFTLMELLNPHRKNLVKNMLFDLSF